MTVDEAERLLKLSSGKNAILKLNDVIKKNGKIASAEERENMVEEIRESIAKEVMKSVTGSLQSKIAEAVDKAMEKVGATITEAVGSEADYLFSW